jgi:hypothetical protein
MEGMEVPNTSTKHANVTLSVHFVPGHCGLVVAALSVRTPPAPYIRTLLLLAEEQAYISKVPLFPLWP